MAGGLRALGLGPGDMVAFQLPNWVEAAITFYACSMLGVTLVPIVHFYGPKELGFILRQSGAKALVIVSRIGQRDYLADLATVRDGLQSLEHVVVVGDIEGDASGYVPFDELRSADPVDGPAHVDPDGPALIGYTSGTTADPKGVVHTHRTLGCEVRQLSDHQSIARPAQPGRGAGRSRHRHAGRAALPALQQAAHLHDRRLGPADRPQRHGRGAHRRRERIDVLLHQPARLSGLRARARRAHALRRAGRLAHPQRGGGAGGRARDLARALVRVDRAPVHHGIPARRAEGEAHPHRRQADGVGRDPDGRRGRSRRRGGGARGDPQPRRRPLRRLHGPRAQRGVHRRRRVVQHRRHRRDRRRRLPDHHGPGEGHHHPWRRERQRRRGRAAAGPHEGRGRGGGGGGTRRAARRARLRLLPHAARQRGPRSRGAAGAPGRRRV